MSSKVIRKCVVCTENIESCKCDKLDSFPSPYVIESIYSTKDCRFLQLAQHIAMWSKHPKHKVGSVIVDKFDRVVSTGYNGLPRLVNDLLTDERHTIHAELNAILFAKRDLTDHTIYVTNPPCSRCAGVIIQSGIGHVVHIEGSIAFNEVWGEDCAEGMKMFNEAEVFVTIVNKDYT